MIRRCILSKVLFSVIWSLGFVPGEVLFHSDFECGQSYLANATKSGSERIELVWNHRIREWPLSGGKGYVEANLPAAVDSFSYTHRRGLTLLGVRGLVRSHPRFAGIKTGNLMEWTKGATLADLRVPGMRIVSGEDAVFGRFSLEKKNESSEHARGSRLGLGFPGELDSLFCRLYVRVAVFASDKREMRAVVFFGQKGSIRFPRLLISKGRGDSAALVSLEPVKMVPGATKNLCGRIERRLVPGRPYCLEYGIRFLDSEQISFALWVNGKPCMERILDGVKDSSGMDYVLSFFPATGLHGFPGRIVFDEVCIGKERIGIKPEQPEIRFSRDTLWSHIGSRIPTEAVQWQLSATNAWLAPEFNSGELTNHFTSLPFPDVHSFLGTVEGSIHFPGTLYTPTKLESGIPYWARMRFRSEDPSWSDWSAPMRLTAPVESIRRKKLAKAEVPMVRDIRLVSLENRKEIRHPEKDKWYNLEVYLENPKGFGNLLTVDIHFHADPEHGLGNFQNRGGRFHLCKNHGVSFSLTGDRAIYVKQPGNESDIWQLLDGETGPFANISDGFPWFGAEKQMLRCRFRFPKESLIGPWVMRGFAVSKDPLLSPMYSKIISLEEPLSVGRHRGRIRGLGIVVVAGLLTVAGLTIVIRAKSHRSGRRKGRRPGEGDEPFQSSSEPVLPYHEKVKTAQNFIRENYTKPISLDDIAAEANVSKSWLVRFFREATGQTVLQFMSELRINEAKRCLVETGLSIKEIGFRSGFGTTRNFNTSFHKATGKSPKEFRESPD